MIKTNAINHRTVVIVLGCLNGLMPFSTDMYLPAFPSIAKNLGTDIGQVALSFSSYFVGACLGQLVNGPILDRFGRKKPMMGGLCVFLLASLACALAQNIETLIIMRFFQAVGISMCAVGSRAVVRDIFPPEKTAGIFSTMALIMGVAPILAPSVGSLVLTFFDWRTVFIVLALMSFALILALHFWLPDVKVADSSLSMRPKAVLSTYLMVIKRPTFLGYSLVTAMTSAALFAWISSSSYIFIELLGLTPQQFGFVFAATASCLMMSNQLNRMLLHRFSSLNIAFGAIRAKLLVCFILLIIVLYFFTIPILITGLCCFMLCLHLITPNAMALTLRSFTKNVGSATAMMGSIQMASSALTTAILSRFHNGTAVPMVVAMIVISVISLVAQYVLKNRPLMQQI